MKNNTGANFKFGIDPNIQGDVLPLFEDAAKEVADEVTRPRSDGNEEVQNIQV